MAVGALIPLILGGGFALDQRRRKLNEQDRLNLARGFSSAVGTAGSPGESATLFNDQQQQIGDLSGVGAVQGTGLLGQENDPRLQQQMVAAANMFGTKGGEKIGESMLAQALLSQDRAATQENLFNQQDQSQQLGFANTNENARLTREQSAANNQANIDERRAVRADEIQRISDATVLQNSAQGTPAGDKVRVPLPGGGEGAWVDVPKYGSTEYTVAAGKVDGLAAQVERMDSMMKLFDEVGTNAFGKDGGELESRYTEAVLGMKNVYQLGVLSESDEKLLRSVMQDPNGFHALTTGDDTIKAGYQNALETLQRTLRGENQKYNLWGIGSDLDKTTPSQIEELKIANEKARLAAEQGLIPGRADPGAAAQSGGGRGRNHRALF